MVQTTKQYTTLDENGLATAEGYFTVYNFSYSSSEYTGSSDEFLMAGVGIPAYSLASAPPATSDGTVVLASGGSWKTVPDYRGKTAYKKDGSGSIEITMPGNLAEELTLDIPLTPYDVWTDAGWVTDTDKQKAAQIDEAEAQKLQLTDQANAYINGKQWPSKLTLGRLTNAEKSEFNLWLDYLDSIVTVDTDSAPDVEWPEQPSK